MSKEAYISIETVDGPVEFTADIIVMDNGFVWIKNVISPKRKKEKWDRKNIPRSKVHWYKLTKH